MKTLQENMLEYRKQLEKGAIQKAYQGLMDFMLALRNHFAREYPDHDVSTGMYQGYMDMTYFAVLPRALRERDLKVAIVFVYDSFRFEVWLSGKNQRVLSRYWKILQESNWSKYRIVAPGKGVDSVLEHTLVEDPDFGDLKALTRTIERGTLQFIKDVEGFLARTPL